MKAYKTPRTKTIKMDAEELMNTLTGSETPVDASDARSKRYTGPLDDDGEGYGD